ncbi:MAG: YfiR family protein [Thermonemataceae bacterium]|nr:YfiR family protein [Thermonemataceae bacterium]
MKKHIIIAWFSLLISVSAYAQLGDYKTHTIYLYNFTKYVKWPASYQTGNFVIGVYGISPVTNQLQTATANKSAGTQKIIIKQYNTIASIDNPHILFIPNLKSSQLASIKQKLQGKSTLIVTEKNGMAKQGSHINFILRDGKWKIEINQKELATSNLQIATQLSRIAIPVN